MTGRLTVYITYSPRYFYSPRGDEIDEPEATSYISEIPQRVRKSKTDQIKVTKGPIGYINSTGETE